MTYKTLLTGMFFFAACGDSTTTQSDASAPSALAACQSVGTSFCERMYTCYSATDIAGFQLPPTQAGCVTEENANCGAATPQPGYCKGTAQTSTSVATMCSAELSALTCAELMQPASGVCKTQLCAP
jgi:hypothetical protein